MEPSAGKGDLAELYIKFANKNRRYGSNFDMDSVDMIEHDANLIALLRGKNYRVIGDDFLTFHSHKHYDLIIMNPPFSNGDEHLLKALELQADGGQIVCLLNAETIRNPYTNRRKVLKQKLAEYGAKIEFVRDAFKHAQRRTDVEVAIVYVNIPAQRKTSTIFENLKKAQSEELHNTEAEPDARGCISLPMPLVWRGGAYNLPDVPSAGHRKDALRRDVRQPKASDSYCICYSAIRRRVLD